MMGTNETVPMAARGRTGNWLGRCGVAMALAALAWPAAASSATPVDSYCPPATPGVPHSALPLRFGVDVPSTPGGIVPASGGVPYDFDKELAGVQALRNGAPLVARLNRLFWSDGESAVQDMAGNARALAAAGEQVEFQVRYHPTQAENGDVAGWLAYVRHVVDVLGANPAVVAMTITNEVNLVESPNTSDGFYESSRDALIQGVIAAKQEALARGYDQLKIGFTYAYRGDPDTDQAFWAYLGAHGGPRFLSALDFVGTDIYPGNEWPPLVVPPDTFGGEMASALATIRTCYFPQGAIPARIPIWVTENGLPSGPAPYSEAQQADALRQEVETVASYSGTYNVTDYRWFSLRDYHTGSSMKSENNGLERDDYTHKPSFAEFRSLIGRYGPPAPAVPSRRASHHRRHHHRRHHSRHRRRHRHRPHHTTGRRRSR